jgi:hypothetical protein
MDVMGRFIVIGARMNDIVLDAAAGQVLRRLVVHAQPVRDAHGRSECDHALIRRSPSHQQGLEPRTQLALIFLGAGLGFGPAIGLQASMDLAFAAGIPIAVGRDPPEMSGAAS